MAEVGIDLSQELPKPLTDQAVRTADVVITMGCGDACPIYPGTRYEDWQLQDPAGQPIEIVRGIRDQIDGRVKQLLRELLPPGFWSPSLDRRRPLEPVTSGSRFRILLPCQERPTTPRPSSRCPGRWSAWRPSQAEVGPTRCPEPVVWRRSWRAPSPFPHRTEKASRRLGTTEDVLTVAATVVSQMRGFAWLVTPWPQRTVSSVEDIHRALARQLVAHAATEG